MTLNIWYKSPAGIWVNGFATESKKEAQEKMAEYMNEGKEVRIISEQHEPPQN